MTLHKVAFPLSYFTVTIVLYHNASPKVVLDARNLSRDNYNFFGFGPLAFFTGRSYGKLPDGP